ncbi:MAG: DUF2207 domain-containing protein [Alphaproteobacteria bacterium]|jgi:hypothetical protein|nr:DUF2207 domain-containing protein [Alphaproteobacteria bacterium]
MRSLPQKVFAAIFVAAILFGGTGQVLAGGHEEILSFISRLHINPNSSVTVTEQITVRATGKQIKRGIYRDFPTTYMDRYGNTLNVRFNVLSATRNNASVPFWVENRPAGKRVYMGDKKVRIKRGVYTFVLTYVTDRQIGFFEDFDEIYWNVTGNDWAFPIRQAEAIVMVPPKAEVVQKAAYTGPRGASGKDFISSIDANGYARFKTTRTLKPGEGLTIAVAWPKGFLTEPSDAEKAARLLQDNSPTLAGLVGFLLVLSYFLFAWNRVGRDPKAGTIAPLFEPPEGFSPAAVHFLTQMGFQDKAFAAAIVNLAVKGVLKIEEDDDEFTLREVSDDHAALSTGETALARGLFRYHNSIVLKSENHKSIGETVAVFKEKLEGELEKAYFLNNKLWLIPGAVLTVLTILVIAALSGATNDEAGFAVVFIPIWLTFWTIGVYSIFGTAVMKWRTVLRSGSLLKAGPAIFITLFAIPFAAGEFFGVFMLAEATSVLTAVIMLAIICQLPLFYHLLKAPTMKGRRILDQIEGFKMYLSVAEKDRLEFLHPPEETPELFERFLPYALALGVENQWSEHFAGVLSAARQAPGHTHAQGYHPGWYNGSSWDHGGISGLGNSLGGSLPSAVTSSSSAPGSSGGGSSGGGGGGGGGGGF